MFRGHRRKRSAQQHKRQGKAIVQPAFDIDGLADMGRNLGVDDYGPPKGCIRRVSTAAVSSAMANPAPGSAR